MPIDTHRTDAAGRRAYGRRPETGIASMPPSATATSAGAASSNEAATATFSASHVG